MLRQIFEGFTRSRSSSGAGAVASGSVQLEPDGPQLYSRQATDPEYGRGAYAIDEEALLCADQAALAQRVVDHFRAPSYHPPCLPPVASRILTLTTRADVDLREILELLEQDAVLTAETFKVAASARYSRGGAAPLRSLRDVVTRLGLSGLSNLILEVGLNMRVFRSPVYRAPMERLRLHSMAVGQLARIICRYASLDGEFAYMCGLLHDLGMVAALLALGDESKGRRPLALEEIWGVLEAAHEEITTVIARAWGLPEEVIAVLSRHHDVLNGGRVHPVSAVIYLADMWVVPMGFDALTPAQRAARGAYVQRQSRRGMEAAIELAGLSPQAIGLIRDDAAQLMSVE